MEGGFVSLEAASLRYGGAKGTLALADATLSVGRGEFIAVVGPSGCGKSTLMKLVSGLMPPTSGKVTLDGRPIRGNVTTVGMAFQNPTLLPWRTTLKNILLPLEIVEPHKTRFRQNPEPYREQARELLALVGLTGFEDKLPWQLSGGMQQRASLCRALIHQPEVLLLDEPFAALDAFTREELWVVLQDLQARTGCTVILVTHDLRESVFLADTVYVMSKRPGRIVSVNRVALARPRRLEDCYSDGFNDTVLGIRQRIVEVQAA